MGEIIKELIELGYKGNIGKGCEGSRGCIREYVHIQFIQEGNSSLIRNLIENGWEKQREFKLFNKFQTIYSGEGMCISFTKFY